MKLLWNIGLWLSCQPESTAADRRLFLPAHRASLTVSGLSTVLSQTELLTDGGGTMPRFVDREAELANLNRLLERPGGQFIIVYGRRWVVRRSKRSCWSVWRRSGGTWTRGDKTASSSVWCVSAERPFERVAAVTGPGAPPDRARSGARSARCPPIPSGAKGGPRRPARPACPPCASDCPSRPTARTPRPPC